MPEWLQHLASESLAVVVLAATAALWRRFRSALARLEGMIDKLGSIDSIKVSLEAHIAQPLEQAHPSAPSAPPGRATMPSSSGSA